MITRFTAVVFSLKYKLSVVYDEGQWRLFTDSPKISLKGVLVHRSNKYTSVPVAHSIHVKETQIFSNTSEQDK
jgi:hypothetical protein